MSSRFEMEYLLGNIVSERGPVLQADDGVIDLDVAKEVDLQREKFENNNYERGKVNLINTLTSPGFVDRFRRVLGARTEDAIELYRFMSIPQTRDIFSDLRNQELAATGKVLNAISRCGIQTVGKLRGANIALLFSRKDKIAYLNGLTIGSAVAAQTAFKKFDTPDAVTPKK